MIEVRNDLGKVLFRLLVQVGNGNASGKNGIVGMFAREVCGGFGGQIL